MSGYRFEIDAQAGPARESVTGGRAMLLVRVRLFDGEGVVNTHTGQPCAQEDVFTDLRAEQARELAFALLGAAEHAERQTEAAGYWQRESRR
jgi:hypothetical protein